MYFTVTDASNKIARIIKLVEWRLQEADRQQEQDDEAMALALEEDPAANVEQTTRRQDLIDLFLSEQLEAEEDAHEGRFNPTEYTFDGTEFIEKAEPDHVPQIIKDPLSTIMILVQQMRTAGYFLPMHKDLVMTKFDAKELIDQAASEACERFVSRGKFTVFEYQLTQSQVEQWRFGGSVETEAPEMLKSWFEHSEYTTLEDAAVNIEQTATQFNTVIQLTRRLRLEGKKAVTDAAGDFKTVMQSYINQLDSI